MFNLLSCLLDQTLGGLAFARVTPWRLPLDILTQLLQSVTGATVVKHFFFVVVVVSSLDIFLYVLIVFPLSPFPPRSTPLPYLPTFMSILLLNLPRPVCIAQMVVNV